MATPDRREQVRQRYALAAADPSCCQTADDANTFGGSLYPLSDSCCVPPGLVEASLGCDNPTAVADLHPGETVLDLGSGGGLDVLLSARRVGPTGFAYGVDMTEEMIALAKANARQAKATNVEFLHGAIEDIPLPDASVDAAIIKARKPS
jgi:SAM-dependent methyltransferase